MISYYYASTFSWQLYSSHAYTDRISINYSTYVYIICTYIYIYVVKTICVKINFHLLCSCG